MKNRDCCFIVVLSLCLLSCTHGLVIDDEIIDDNRPRSCLMIVPDIQNYTDKDNGFSYLDAIVEYYRTNLTITDACLQVGDLTNNNKLWQYENAYNHFIGKFQDSDQFVFCLGNHDYGDNGSSNTRFSNIQPYMMPLADIRMDPEGYENCVRHIKLGKENYAVLVLEFCTRNHVLEWANQIVSSEPDVNFIILTHAFLNDYGQLFDYSDSSCENGGSPKQYSMDGEYKNDSMEVFKKLIFENSNIRMVICGHCLTPSYINVQTKQNVKGEDVHFIMVNYQHYSNGGDGYVGLLYDYGNHYRIRSYSTTKKKFSGIDIKF